MNHNFGNNQQGSIGRLKYMRHLILLKLYQRFSILILQIRTTPLMQHSNPTQVTV